jgi:hypothetical protein
MSAPVLINVIQGDSNATLFYDFSTTENIVNYKYSLDKGNNFTPFDPPQHVTDGSYVITDLSNGSLYNVSLQYIYANDNLSEISNTFTFEPGVPMAPTNLQPMITTNNSIVVFFIPPESNGLDASVNYYYSLDNTIWLNNNLFFNDSTAFSRYQSISINNMFQSNYKGVYISAFNPLSYIYGNGFSSLPFNIDFSTFTSNEVNGKYLVNIDPSTNINILSNFSSIVSYINYNDTKSIGRYQFANFTSLLGVTIPTDCSSIVDKAFYNTPTLQNLTITGPPINNDVIQYNAFDLNSNGNNFANINFTINGFHTQSVNQLEGTYLDVNIIITKDTSFSNIITKDASFSNIITKDASFSNIIPISNIVTGVYFDSTVTNISSNVWNNCPNISTITIYSTVGDIEDYAFADLPNLTTVTFVQDISSNSVPLLPLNVFSNCPNLSYINGVGVGVTNDISLNVTIKNDNDYQVLKYIAPLVSNVYIGPNVNNIPAQAFANCIHLQSVYGPDANILQSIESVGYRAFYNCSQIKSLDLHSVTSFADEVFFNCNNLTNVTFNSSLNHSNFGKNVFSGCTSLKTIITNGYVNVLDVSENAINGSDAGLHLDFFDFYNISTPYRSNVYEIDFSNTLYQYIIPDYAFLNYTGLQNVTLPFLCYIIGNNAFTGCTSLQTVDLSFCSDLQTIGNYSFANCSKLQTFSIPDHGLVIGVNIFQGCTNLNTIISENGTVTVALDVRGTNTGLTMILDASTALTTDVLTPIRQCVTNIVYNNDVEIIGAFDQNASFYSVQSITIPSSVTTLQTMNGVYQTFGNFSALAEVTIPSSIESFSPDENFHSAGIFYQCGGLQSVTYNTSTDIPGVMFYDCISLTNIDITGSIRNIGGGAFTNCRSLQSITLPDSLETINEAAFDGTGLTTLTLPQNVNYISGTSFGNTPLSSVIITGATTIDNFRGGAFGNCPYIDSITIYYDFFDANNLGDIKSNYETAATTYTINSEHKSYNRIKNDVFQLNTLYPTITIITP